MRSIIFTSALLIAAAPLFAAPPNMWFARTYGEAHLAKTPDLGRAKGTWQGGTSMARSRAVLRTVAPKPSGSVRLNVMRIDRLAGDSLLVRLAFFCMGSGDGCDAASVASTNGVARRWGGIKGMGRPEPASSSSAGPAGSCSRLSCRPRPGRGGSMVHLIQVNGHRRRRRQ